ncbi:MAG: Na-translocating system protein MpsC family protein, partial [Bacillota bacterium]
MTLGEISDEINKAVTGFEKNIMGRGPERINTIISGDLIIIRLEGFFSVAEQRLARNGGVEQVKKMRTLLF